MFKARCGGGVWCCSILVWCLRSLMKDKCRSPFDFAQGRLSTHHPQPPPQRAKALFGDPGKARGAPFAQDDNCCFDLNSRDRTLAAKTKTSRGWAPGVHDLSSFLGWILRGLKPPPTADGRRPVYSDLGFAPHRRRPAHRDEAADPEGSPTGHSFSRFED